MSVFWYGEISADSVTERGDRGKAPRHFLRFVVFQGTTQAGRPAESLLWISKKRGDDFLAQRST